MLAACCRLTARFQPMAATAAASVAGVVRAELSGSAVALLRVAGRYAPMAATARIPSAAAAAAVVLRFCQARIILLALCPFPAALAPKPAVQAASISRPIQEARN